MVVTRWLKHPGDLVNYGEPICEVLIDGQTRTFCHNEHGEIWGIWGHVVHEGQEVGWQGWLLDYNVGETILTDFTGVEAPRADIYRPRSQYPRVFLNYRKEDSDAWAGRIHEVLANEFSEADVFMDQFSLVAGDDYPVVIQQCAVRCSAMVVLIGPRWVSIANQSGVPRLKEDDDLVHREIVAALDRQILVVPLRLPDTPVPDRYDLPFDMRDLIRSHMPVLSNRSWKVDRDQQIISPIAHHLGKPQADR